MEITCEEIEHLAELSNFSLSDTEVLTLRTDLENIIHYISELQHLDTKNVPPTYQVTNLENIWRSDEPTLVDPAPLLALAPETINSQIKVPKVL